MMGITPQNHVDATAAIFGLSLLPLGAETISVSLNIPPARLELRPGLLAQVWAYNSAVPGSPIVARVGAHVVIDVTNQLLVPMNVHWHGLEVPNDQGPPPSSRARSITTSLPSYKPAPTGITPTRFPSLVSSIADSMGRSS